MSKRLLFTLYFSFLLGSLSHGLNPNRKGDEIGKNGVETHVKITDGIEAQEHEFPYLVSIQAMEPLGGLEHICGGVIVSDNYIVTAAQCVQMQSTHNLRVVAGEHNFYVSSGDEQTVAVSNFRKHEDYQSSPLVNDIALIKLKQSLNLINGKIEVIAMSDVAPAINTECQIAGWGAVSASASYNEAVLRKATLKIVSNSECEEKLSKYTIHDSMVCAGKDGSGHCFGDEGGPLVCGGQLQGIVTFGNGCGKEDMPGVYTLIPHFKHWIENSISYFNSISDDEDQLPIVNATESTRITKSFDSPYSEEDNSDQSLE